MLSDTTQLLRQVTTGLLYPAGVGFRWEAFEWPGTGGLPNPDWVRRRGFHQASVPASQLSVDEFFAPLEQDRDDDRAVPARYRVVAAAVREHLSDAIVVRVGVGKVTVYVVGRTPDGLWAGLKTTAIDP
ncbi:nuclease A inhibitor family protein [Urbifossiella limnaea]|uniref:Nuclease A inhibitor-like protein n=1 Tax=Urbifossiella limnaea TaxID=2528023 RepID=A0A517Y392_9BACT|nr:nuclease A inhibitor family protein [Urbifossiella limnaea]QDU24144.1 Nuclease A inhibitor-like protein [Urbifossiella limnaea]